MNFFSNINPFPYNYSNPTQIYTQSPQFTFNPSYLEHGIFLQEKLNSETAFSQLQQKYDELLLNYNSVKEQLNQITKKQSTQIQKRKFIRRKQDELEKQHTCCYGHCKKEYASILALNLHIKTKHRGGTKKQRDDRAREIMLAEAQGRPIPMSKITLPVGYFETYREEHKTLLGVFQEDKQTH